MGAFRYLSVHSDVESEGRGQPHILIKYEFDSKLANCIGYMTIRDQVAEFLVLSPIANVTSYPLRYNVTLVSGRQILPKFVYTRPNYEFLMI